MLTDQSAVIVRATLPAVGAAIEDITGRFYERLFAAHPELLRDLFNRGNQAAGAQRQALAGSIAAFATYLVDHPDDRPDVMLHRIAHKHASLGVRADQYSTVHEHLFAAIAEVLGDAVTPEVAQAWDEVYWLMANALTTIEERLYAEAGVVDANVWREWEVIARTDATADVAAFALRPGDGRPAPAFKAGQYVSVQVQLADGARQIRQYSLTGAPSATTRSIAVKRVHGAAGTPTARSRAICTRTSAKETGCASRPRTAIWSSRPTRPRCCWRRPASAARPCSPCWSSSRPSVTQDLSRSCTRTVRPTRTRCAPSTRR